MGGQKATHSTKVHEDSVVKSYSSRNPVLAVGI